MDVDVRDYLHGLAAIVLRDIERDGACRAHHGLGHAGDGAKEGRDCGAVHVRYALVVGLGHDERVAVVYGILVKECHVRGVLVHDMRGAPAIDDLAKDAAHGGRPAQARIYRWRSAARGVAGDQAPPRPPAAHAALAGSARPGQLGFNSARGAPARCLTCQETRLARLGRRLPRKPGGRPARSAPRQGWGGSNYCPAHRVHIMAELHRQALLCIAGCEVVGGRLVGACEAHETIARQLQHEGTVALC